MQSNFNLDRPKEGQKRQYFAAYVIDPDQLSLFPIPPQKAEISPFQSVYGANSHRATIKKAAKFIKKSQKS